MAAPNVTWEGSDTMTLDALRRREPASLDELLGLYGRDAEVSDGDRGYHAPLYFSVGVEP